jgi:antitoxin (DNA-binding transcriptional repressor) of toxin-antitoxin stability system
MKRRYSVAQVRERLSAALDEAERGEPVIIERHGVRYQLTRVSAQSTRTRPRKPRIEVLDAAVTDGQWTWDWTPQGVAFRPRTR